jgi:hypothetical protein
VSETDEGVLHAVTMVKELPQRRRHFEPARLLSIDGIQSLISDIKIRGDGRHMHLREHEYSQQIVDPTWCSLYPSRQQAPIQFIIPPSALGSRSQRGCIPAPCPASQPESPCLAWDSLSGCNMKSDIRHVIRQQVHYATPEWLEDVASEQRMVGPNISAEGINTMQLQKFGQRLTCSSAG